MERFCIPYMPRSRVKRAFISEILPIELERELNDMGIITYRLGHTNNLTSELKYHPDILLNNFGPGIWICEYDPKYLPKLPHRIFLESENELDDAYPLDCPFNNFRLGEVLFCGTHVDHLIEQRAQCFGYKIIRLNTSYVKCNCIPVTMNAIITSDRRIGKILRSNDYDVLTVEDKSGIGLRGFSNGLIGGCAAKISLDTLVFTGNLNTFKYGDSIRDFCANHGVDAMSLTYDPMYDYGGILPITEFNDSDNPEEEFSY